MKDHELDWLAETDERFPRRDTWGKGAGANIWPLLSEREEFSPLRASEVLGASFHGVPLLTGRRGE